MGIDPGIGVTGYGVIRGKGSSIILVNYGAIKTNTKESLSSRLRFLYVHLKEVLGVYQPDEVAIEQVFLAQNVSSTLKLGQARGVALMTSFASGAALGEYSPLEVKKAVVGVGRATKRQVQVMVQRILGMQKIPEPNDAADALAIAICHYNTIRSNWPIK